MPGPRSPKGHLPSSFLPPTLTGSRCCRGGTCASKAGAFPDPAPLASRGIERKVGALVVFSLACGDIAGSPREGRTQEAATDEDGDDVADPAGAVGKPSSSEP